MTLSCCHFQVFHNSPAMSCLPLMVEERQIDSDEDEDRLRIADEEEEDAELLALRKKSQQVLHRPCGKMENFM